MPFQTYLHVVHHPSVPYREEDSTSRLDPPTPHANSIEVHAIPHHVARLLSRNQLSYPLTPSHERDREMGQQLTKPGVVFHDPSLQAFVWADLGGLRRSVDKEGALWKREEKGGREGVCREGGECAVMWVERLRFPDDRNRVE